MTHTKLTGGEIIASGGFGCVFKPALKCKNKTIKYKKGQISKLMVKYESEKEYREITRYKKVLSTIPNYSKYFIIDNISICEPSPLTKSDLKNYDAKCYALQSDNFTKETINTKRNKLMAINMPDGGIDLYDYLNTIKYDKLSELNNNLIDLLVNGIVPMNKLGIFHSDVKDSNILVKPTCRLIDWGLSTEYTPSEQRIPREWDERPFQYNVPFSNILFNKYFINMYETFLKKNPNPSFGDVQIFVSDYILFWSKKRGPGHYDGINRIFKIIYFDKITNVPRNLQSSIIDQDITMNKITEYLSTIIIKYTHNGKIHLFDYMKNVYSKIIDIWGFIMCYKQIIETLHINYNHLNKHEHELFNALTNIFNKYLFEPRVEPIILSKLVKDLKSLNKLFHNCTTLLSIPYTDKYIYESTLPVKPFKNNKSINRHSSINKTKKRKIVNNKTILSLFTQ
jgi:hypothetical protein